MYRIFPWTICSSSLFALPLTALTIGEMRNEECPRARPSLEVDFPTHLLDEIINEDQEASFSSLQDAIIRGEGPREEPLQTTIEDLLQL